MGLARSALEFRRQVVQLRQQVVGLLASNIGPGHLTPGVIRELSEIFDTPVSTIYSDVRAAENEAGAGRRVLVNSPNDAPPGPPGSASG
jgi:hypothetical protein